MTSEALNTLPPAGAGSVRQPHLRIQPSKGWGSLNLR